MWTCHLPMVNAPSAWARARGRGALRCAEVLAVLVPGHSDCWALYPLPPPCAPCPRLLVASSEQANAQKQSVDVLPENEVRCTIQCAPRCVVPGWLRLGFLAFAAQLWPDAFGYEGSSCSASMSQRQASPQTRSCSASMSARKPSNSEHNKALRHSLVPEIERV